MIQSLLRLKKHGTKLGVFALALMLAGCGFLPSGRPPTLTPYPFVTASPAPAATPLPTTATVPPSPTPRPAPPSATLRGSPVAPTIGPQDTLTPGPSPTVAGVEGVCSVLPKGGFGVVFEMDPGVPPAIGCPISPNTQDLPHEWIVDTRWQPFERGEMLWSAALGWDLNRPIVYVLYNDGTYQRYEDTFNQSTDPLIGELPPPSGFFEPEGNLGKVWREGPGVSARLGWATGPEIHERTFMQVFTSGEMIFVVPVRKTYVYFHGSPNTYLTYDVSFDQ